MTITFIASQGHHVNNFLFFSFLCSKINLLTWFYLIFFISQYSCFIFSWLMRDKSSRQEPQDLQRGLCTVEPPGLCWWPEEWSRSSSLPEERPHTSPLHCRELPCWTDPASGPTGRSSETKMQGRTPVAQSKPCQWKKMEPLLYQTFFCFTSEDSLPALSQERAYPIQYKGSEYWS